VTKNIMQFSKHSYSSGIEQHNLYVQYWSMTSYNIHKVLYMIS